MQIHDFLEHLQALTGQPRHLPHSPTVHVAVNNAGGRPSATILEFQGPQPLALLVSNLQAPDYTARTLVLGRQVWRVGERSITKRELCALIDTFLAEIDIELDEPLRYPVGYVGKGT